MNIPLRIWVGGAEAKYLGKYPGVGFLGGPQGKMLLWKPKKHTFAGNREEVVRDTKVLCRASVPGSYALERTKVLEFGGRNRASKGAQCSEEVARV